MSKIAALFVLTFSSRWIFFLRVCLFFFWVFIVVRSIFAYNITFLWFLSLAFGVLKMVCCPLFVSHSAI